MSTYQNSRSNKIYIDPNTMLPIQPRPQTKIDPAYQVGQARAAIQDLKADVTLKLDPNYRVTSHDTYQSKIEIDTTCTAYAPNQDQCKFTRDQLENLSDIYLSMYHEADRISFLEVVSRQMDRVQCNLLKSLIEYKITSMETK